MALTILDPTAERDPAGRPLAQRTEAPRTVGLLEIRKPRGDVFLDELEALLRNRLAARRQAVGLVVTLVLEPIPVGTHA